VAGHKAARTAALAVVAGAHALALTWLLYITDTRQLRPDGDAASMLVVLLAPPAAARELPRASAAAAPGRGTELTRPGTAAAAPRASIAAPPIDWSAEAQAAAARAVGQAEEARGRARAFTVPPTGAAFAPPAAHGAGISWNYAATHRVEAQPGGVTVIHLNDHCALAFVIVLPFFGCAIGKIPARGDLFEHMHEGPAAATH
jgi:hypothetical protein